MIEKQTHAPIKKKEKNIVIGLTGGFCTGKSTVRELFKSFGAHTLSCDDVAHYALRKNTGTYKKIVRLFGKQCLKANGAIDRRAVSAIVFKDKTALARLESIIHPYVTDRMLSFIEKKKGIRIIEVPLLFEAHMEHFFDAIIVVSALKRDCVARAQDRFSSLSKKDITARIDTQFPLAAKRKKADFVIHNTTIRNTINQTKHIWSVL